MLGLSAVCNLTQGTGPHSRVGPGALCCGCPRLLRNGINADTKSHCTLYVTIKLPLEWDRDRGTYACVDRWMVSLNQHDASSVQG